MKKILFYTANGVGLGHLKRTQLIAQELRKKKIKIKILLASSSPTPDIFGRFYDYLVRLVPLSDALLAIPSKTFETRLSNGDKLAKVFMKFKPNIAIADFYLASPFTFYPFGHALEQNPVDSIFVWRLGDAKSFQNDLNNNKEKINLFKRIIFPHSQKELEDLLPSNVFKKIKIEDKFEICGPIFRKLDKKRILTCRKKYNVSANDFLITITLGGGGVLKGGQCDNPDRLLKQFLNIYPILSKKIPNLKIVIVGGPYLQRGGKEFLARLKFVRFEENLLELMKLSNLVISAAGYNTCNEIIEAKTPAILMPLMRGNKEQFERAAYLEKKGIVKVFKGGSSARFLNLILNCKKDLNKMRSNFKKFSDWRSGNQKAAKIILKAINE